MKIQKAISGIDPEKYVGKEVMFEITGITAETKQDKNGREYQQFNLEIVGNNNGKIDDFAIRYLFNRDLNFLIEEFGEDTEKWIGQKVLISAKNDGQYKRWVLLPVV